MINLCARTWTLHVVLLALPCICAVSTVAWHPRAPAWDPDALEPGEVRLETVLKWNKPVLWIDARAQPSFSARHVPGALPLNLADWDGQIQAVVDAWNPDQPTVVYCDQRACRESRQVVETLKTEYGLTNIYSLKHGWNAWLRHTDKR